MKVKVRIREGKKGKSHLSLDKYWGSVNGKSQRKTESLKLWIYTKPQTPEQRTHNREQKLLAEKIATKLQNEHNHNKHGFVNDDKLNGNFIEFFYLLSDEKKNENNEGNWKSAYKHLVKYAGDKVTFRELSVEFVEGFKNYLQQEATKKTDEKLSVNTQVSYFRKLKAAFKQGVKRGYLTVNYSSQVEGIKEEETYREYLTKEEFEKLANTPLKPDVLRRAFIFSCLTGIRFGDVKKLTWEDIEEYKEGKFRVKFRQSKTKGLQYLILHPQAVQQIGEKKQLSDKVFFGLKYDNERIKTWAAKAGIEKNLSYHVSRHTAATLLMTYGVDLYIIKEILGHKHIHTTEIYTKIVDERKEGAIDKLPTFDI
ncbi:site-specific integrase [Corallibacter sp.]|uniref:site-specific integrase n=1 Tax=Corallibacter sp. TaxID=2038084 RepID=UPI003AB67B8C